MIIKLVWIYLIKESISRDYEHKLDVDADFSIHMDIGSKIRMNDDLVLKLTGKSIMSV